MFTSDIESNSKDFVKTSFIYLVISLFCILFGAVYEYFSHEVYSGYMIYAFVFPLAGGAFPYPLMYMLNSKLFHVPNIYHFGIATLTVGSIMQGILDIYGTTNEFVRFYWYVGAAEIVIGGVVLAVKKSKIKWN